MGIPKVTLFGSCWAEVCDVKCGKMYQIYFQILNNSKKTDRQVVFLLCKKSQAKYTMRLKHSQPPNERGDDSSPLSDALKKKLWSDSASQNESRSRVCTEAAKATSRVWFICNLQSSPFDTTAALNYQFPPRVLTFEKMLWSWTQNTEFTV